MAKTFDGNSIQTENSISIILFSMRNEKWSECRVARCSICVSHHRSHCRPNPTDSESLNWVADPAGLRAQTQRTQILAAISHADHQTGHEVSNRASTPHSCWVRYEPQQMQPVNYSHFINVVLKHNNSIFHLTKLTSLNMITSNIEIEQQSYVKYLSVEEVWV